MRRPAAFAPVASAQARITCGSLTAMPTISSTPAARRPSATRMKLGTCWVEQTPVKAPGTAKSTTLRPANSDSLGTSAMPPSPFSRKVAAGNRSPIAMVMDVAPFPRLRGVPADI